MNRGVDRADIFFGDADRVEFGQRLAEIHERFAVETLAYCLMPNHYHLLLRATEGGLSQAMHHLSLTYTRHTNDRVGRDGPIFRGRFHSIPVLTDAYLACATRYIHLNPLVLADVDLASEFRWSSYRAYLGLRRQAAFLNTELVGGLFGHDPAEVRRFTEAGLPVELDLATALLLADLMQSAADTLRPDAGGTERDNPALSSRLALMVLADVAGSKPLHEAIVGHLGFPSASARRMAFSRARRLSEHPMVGQVLAAINPQLLVSDPTSCAGEAA